MAEEEPTAEEEAPEAKPDVKLVKIRTLVAMSGADLNLAVGDEYEVDEATANGRIAAGLAEAVDPPATPAKRATTKRAGKEVETTSTAPAEEREAT